MSAIHVGGHRVLIYIFPLKIEFVYILLYVDDIALLSESLAPLHSMMEIVQLHLQDWCLTLNFERRRYWRWKSILNLDLISVCQVGG